MNQNVPNDIPPQQACDGGAIGQGGAQEGKEEVRVL